MKAKLINETLIEGFLYEHSLEEKVTGKNSKTPNTKYISGKVSILTDNAGVNVVDVHYSYVTQITKSGKTNNTYTILNKIINKELKTVMDAGKDNASAVRINSALGLNEFYTDKSGRVEFVSAKRNEGGFISVINASELKERDLDRATFRCDILINGFIHKEADEENGYPEKGIVKGAIFDYSKSLLPVEFSVTNPKAIEYFENQDITQKTPMFTTIWGRQISETTVRRIEEESSFGESYVKEVKSNKKDFIITGALKEPYMWDDESSITVQELNQAISNREIYLATLRQNYEDYKNQKKAPSVPLPTSIPNGVYEF